MNGAPVPWYVTVVLSLPGFVLIAIALPLVRGQVRPNPTYGFRIAATFADERVWYAMNRRAGRDLAVIGVIYLCAVFAATVVGTSMPFVARVLGPFALLFAMLMIDAIFLIRAARRMLRQLPTPGATKNQRSR